MDQRPQRGASRATRGEGLRAPAFLPGQQAKLCARVVFASVLIAIYALPAAAQNSWGSVAKAEEPKPWSFYDAIAPGFWMAWTNATALFFVFIFSCIALMGFFEWRRPGGAERDGVLGLTTTRGDRLFISLLGSAYIFLAWLGLVGTPLWAPLGIAILWGGFVFWKV